jgi:hypothetical protein
MEYGSPLFTTTFLKIGKLYKKGVFIGTYSNEGIFWEVVVAVWGINGSRPTEV